jgi:hypothetical protein
VDAACTSNKTDGSFLWWRSELVLVVHVASIVERRRHQSTDSVSRKTSTKIHILGSISAGRRRHRMHGSVVARTKKIMEGVDLLTIFGVFLCFYETFANEVRGTFSSLAAADPSNCDCVSRLLFQETCDLVLKRQKCLLLLWMWLLWLVPAVGRRPEEHRKYHLNVYEGG